MNKIFKFEFLKNYIIDELWFEGEDDNNILIFPFYLNINIHSLIKLKF